MLGKRSKPIRKLIEPVISGNPTGFYGENLLLSPTSPLDLKIRSPRGWKNQDSEGIGLGIVAALEKSGSHVPTKIMVGHSNRTTNVSASQPIPISAKSSSNCRGCLAEFEMGGPETCTRGISHGPKSNFSRGYWYGDKVRGDFDPRWPNLKVFCPSPPKVTEESPAYPTADFLKFCYLCRKNLHGRDIYMYRGDKAFCSMECRYRQIVSDERKEKCVSEASKPSKISSSPYSGKGLFSTGIVVF